MAKGFKHGSGGSNPLNFKVVGNPKPENPKENTIWVNTDQKITSWIFSATEPTEPLEGIVWIKTGTSSIVEFNALKKNGIQVYPISAKQYIGGAWVDREAKSFQQGVWVEWIPEGSLYYKGNEITHVTGGWKQATWLSSQWGTVTRNSESIALDGSNKTNAFLVTEEKIDLTYYTTLKLNALTSVGNSSSYGAPEFFIVDNNENPKDANRILRQTMASGAGIKSTDITSINGLYYVAISAGSWASGTVRLEFDHVWLE